MNDDRERPALRSKKFRMCLVGVGAIVIVVGIAAFEPAIVAAVAAACGGIAACVSVYCGGQAAVDYRAGAPRS
jgi:hypothetical protein